VSDQNKKQKEQNYQLADLGFFGYSNSFENPTLYVVQCIDKCSHDVFYTCNDMYITEQLCTSTSALKNVHNVYVTLVYIYQNM